MSRGTAQIRLRLRGWKKFNAALRRVERQWKTSPGAPVPGHLLPFSKLRYRPSRRRRTTRKR